MRISLSPPVSVSSVLLMLSSLHDFQQYLYGKEGATYKVGGLLFAMVLLKMELIFPC